MGCCRVHVNCLDAGRSYDQSVFDRFLPCALCPSVAIFDVKVLLEPEHKRILIKKHYVIHNMYIAINSKRFGEDLLSSKKRSLCNQYIFMRWDVRLTSIKTLSKFTHVNDCIRRNWASLSLATLTFIQQIFNISPLQTSYFQTGLQVSWLR